MMQPQEDIFQHVRQRALKQTDNKGATNWKHMVTVLDAVTEVLQLQNQQSPTAYWGALVAALEKEKKPTQIAATLQLVQIASPHVSVAVFRVKFQHLFNLYTKLLAEHERSDSIIKQLLSCITFLLQAQDNESWSGNESVRVLLQKLIICVTDPQVTIRNRAKECINNLVSTQKPALLKVASESFAQYTALTIEEVTTKDVQKTVDLLEILPAILKYFNGAAIISIARQLLKLLPLKHTQLSLGTYVTFAELFASDCNSISADSLSQLLQVLQTFQPHTADVNSSIQFIRMLKEGFLMLHRLNSEMSSANIATVFQTLLGLFASDSQEIASNTSDAIKVLVAKSISDAMIVEALNSKGGSSSEMDDQDQAETSSPLLTIIQVFTKAINYKNKTNLDLVLGAQEQLFKRIGKHSYPLLNNMLISMEKLYDSADFRFQSSLEKAIAVAISVMGPRRVLELLPLNISGGPAKPRTWLFPVLRKGVRNTELKFFQDYFMVLADRFMQRSLAAAKNDEKMTAKNYKAYYDQTYGLLPGFCSYPTDYSKVFPQIAKSLGLILSQDVDLQITICHALLRVINISQEVIAGEQLPENVEYSVETAKATIATTAKFSKNFLPLLFTVYGDTTELNRGIISETIAAFCSISDQQLVDDYFKQVLKKLLEAATDLNKQDLTVEDKKTQTQKRNIMVDLALAIAPCLSHHTVNLLYEVFKPLLRDTNHTSQKKAYRAMSTICVKQPEFTRLHLNDLLLTFADALNVCDDASRHYRTKCLMGYVELMDAATLDRYLPQFLAEAIMVVKGKNKKAKETATTFIRGLVRKCTFNTANFSNVDQPLPQHLSQQEQQGLHAFFQKLLGALAAQSDVIISGAILVISSLIVEYAEYISALFPEILKSVLILIQYESADVIMAVIGFIRTCLAIVSDDVMKSLLPSVIPVLVEHSSKKGSGPIRPKVTFLIEKLIQKYGYEFVRSHFPQNKESFVKNINKQLRRKERTEKGSENATSDEAMLRTSGDEPLDLLDPSMINKISSKKSLEKMNDDDDDDIQIKQNKHGKFVIYDEGEQQPDPKDKKKDKKKAKKRSRDDMEIEQAIDDYGDADAFEGEDDEEKKFMEHKPAKKTKLEDQIAEESDPNRLAALKYLQRKQEERKRKKEESKATLGQDYQSKKRGAGGDMKRPGKADPFAYIPLNPKRLNRRERNKPSDFTKLDQTVRTARKFVVKKRGGKK